MSTPEEADAQLRRAAARHHDDVASTIDLDTALAASRRRSHGPAAIALSVAAIVVLVGGVLLVRPGNDDVDVAVDEDGLEDVEQDEGPVQPDFDNAPAPIGLGAPDDGKASVQLPVVAEPATGLVDGQTVAVSGKGFPPNASVGVVMCTREAGRDHGARGVEACDIGHYSSVTSDGQGIATTEFEVRRIMSLDGQEVDCASEPGRCIIAMGLISDYDQSGGFAVDFDPSVPLPDPPTVEVSKTEGIADGETVDVTVTGLVPHSSLSMQQCSGDGACADTILGEQRTDGSGTYVGSVRLWRNFGAHGPTGPQNIDCAETACQLIVHGEVASSREVPAKRVSFDPSRGGRTAPVLRLLDQQPFSPGDRFRVEVSGTSEGQFVDVQVCPDQEGGECAAFGYAEADDDVTIVEMRVDGSGRCDEGCPMTAYIHSAERGPEPSTGPPALFARPIIVTITG